MTTQYSDARPVPQLADPLSLVLVGTGGALVLLADGPLWQFGAAYLVLAIARVALARWFVAPDTSKPSDADHVHDATIRVTDRDGAQRIIDDAAGALGIAAVLALLATVLIYGSNIPFWDEFVSTLKFITSFGEMTTGECLNALVAGHYGHRIVTQRLAALVQWRLTGALSFTQLMAIAFACLAAAACAIYAGMSGMRRRPGAPALFAPFLLILFQPQYHQLTLWGFSVQHFAALLFEALAVLLLARGNRTAYLWAIAALVLATFSFGNGILLGPLGLAYLCVQRRDREAIGWLVITTLLAALYFHGLGIGPTQGAKPGLAAQAAYLFEFLGSAVTLGYFTDFIGAMDAQTADHPALVWPARATGLLIVVGFAWLTMRRYWRRNFTVYGLLALTVGSGALAALHRTGADYASPFMSRYTMHSALCLGLLYLAFAERFPQRARKFLPVSLAVAVAFCAGSYAVTLPYMKLHRGDMRFSAWMASNAIYTGEPVTIATPFFDLKLLEKASENGVYALPTREILSVYGTSFVDESAEPAATSRIVYRGENTFWQTLLLNVPESADGLAVVRVSLAGMERKVYARPISTLSIHPRLLRNSGYGDATHMAVLIKLPSP